MAIYTFGRDLLRFEGAFDGRSVFLENPYEMQTADTLRKMQTFNLKKEAIAFCKKWGLAYSQIIRIQTRFQYAWVISLGRNDFVPVHAEGHLLAHKAGKILLSVEERDWING